MVLVMVKVVFESLSFSSPAPVMLPEKVVAEVEPVPPIVRMSPVSSFKVSCVDVGAAAPEPSARLAMVLLAAISRVAPPPSLSMVTLVVVGRAPAPEIFSVPAFTSVAPV